MLIQSINPYNNEILVEYTSHSNDVVQNIIEKSYQAYLSWKKTALPYRANLMLKVASLLEENKNEYALAITKEMGKVLRESMAEVGKCATLCRYYAEKAEQFLADEPLFPSSGKAFISYHPLGPVLAIMPWNFPFWQVFRFAVPALLAGNTGILKHASNVPQCALLIEKIFLEAGFPGPVFSTVLISSSEVAAMIGHKLIAAATLTGSDPAGRSVAMHAGKNLKKTVLELGGSDPFIVLEDANLKLAAETAAIARMINCGQSCIAAKRFIVHEKVLGDFKDIFFNKLSSLKQGNPELMETDYACMARKDLADELYLQVKQSMSFGASLSFGVLPHAISNAKFPILAIENIPKNAPAYSEELFGPVASIFPVKSDDEAIQLANDSKFGLGGSVWTIDLDKGVAMAKKVESGAVYVNKLMASDPAIPFGGIKTSGYGRELAHIGIREFTNQKSIWVQ